MSSRLSAEQLGAVAGLFRVLGEPLRLAILQELKGGPRSVGELVEAVGGKQANVSKQLGVMFAAGLLDRRRDGSRVLYRVREPVVFELCGLLCDRMREEAERRARQFARPAGD